MSRTGYQRINVLGNGEVVVSRLYSMALARTGHVVEYRWEIDDSAQRLQDISPLLWESA